MGASPLTTTIKLKRKFNESKLVDNKEACSHLFYNHSGTNQSIQQRSSLKMTYFGLVGLQVQ